MTNRVFKRTPINIIKNLLYTLFTPVFIYIAAYFLLQFTGLEAKMQEMIAIGSGINLPLDVENVSR
ncbi:hypothetical protein MGH68_18230 [Erysipelothrix sp. D19-032]